MSDKMYDNHTPCKRCGNTSWIWKEVIFDRELPVCANVECGAYLYTELDYGISSGLFCAVLTRGYENVSQTFHGTLDEVVVYAKAYANRMEEHVVLNELIVFPGGRVRHDPVMEILSDTSPWVRIDEDDV